MILIGLVLFASLAALLGGICLAARRGHAGALAVLRFLAFVVSVAAIAMVGILAKPAQAAEGGILVDLPKWTPTLLGLGSLGLAVLVLYLSTRFTLKQDHKETVLRLAKMEERLSAVENRVGALPDREQITRLMIDLERTNGEIKGLTATIVPMRQHLMRLEDWLIDKDKGGRT